MESMGTGMGCGPLPAPTSLSFVLWCGTPGCGEGAPGEGALRQVAGDHAELVQVHQGSWHTHVVNSGDMVDLCQTLIYQTWDRSPIDLSICQTCPRLEWDWQIDIPAEVQEAYGLSYI